MVQTDAGDDTNFGDDYVGAVQTASQTDFDHGKVDFLVGEPAECHPCRNLEERQVKPVESILPAANEVPYLFPAYHPCRSVRASVDDAHPLPEIQDVGRSVQTYFQTCRGQGRSQHVGYRTLAVGPRHVDGPELPVRMPEQGPEGFHVLQSWLVGISESGLLYGWETHEQFFEFVLILCFVHVDFLELNSNLAIFTT